MAPTVVPEEDIEVDPHAYDDSSPVPGDVIVLQDPEGSGKKLLKRIERVESAGGVTQLYVTGDNPLRSRDSRHFGPVPLDRVVGKVTTPLAARE